MFILIIIFSIIAFINSYKNPSNHNLFINISSLLLYITFYIYYVYLNDLCFSLFFFFLFSFYLFLMIKNSPPKIKLSLFLIYFFCWFQIINKVLKIFW